MKMKRLLSLALCAALAAVLLPGSALADTAGGFTISGGASGTDYSYDAGAHTLTIKTGTAMTISGTTTADRIILAAGITANITLNGVDIDSASCAFEISGGTTVNLTLASGTNNGLESGDNKAGLCVPDNSALIIAGTGTLSARGGSSGAGIGGNAGGTCGSVTINRGIVYASGGTGASGIGGGSAGAGGAVVINGGKVKAMGGSLGTGIGSGLLNTSNGSCRITGGSVNANVMGPNVYADAGSTTRVYLTTVALEDVSAHTAVTSLTTTLGSSAYSYGINDLITDSSGKLYLYLPEGTVTTAAKTAAGNYTGSVTTTTSAFTSHGELRKPGVAITTTSLPAAAVGVPYSQSISYTYTGSGTVSFITSGLPAGLGINTATGVISGTPAAGSNTGSPYTVQVMASDGTLSDTETFTLVVNAAPPVAITTASLPDGEVGKAYSHTVAVTNTGGGTLAFSATGLPAGLSINATTGVISGTPAWDTNLSSPYNVTVQAAAGGNVATKTYPLVIIKKYVINASAGSGGTITPSGAVNVLRNSSQTFTFKANSGYKISSVTVDGVNKGALSSYTFSNIIDPHTISVKFSSTSGSSDSGSSDDDDDSVSSSTYISRTLMNSETGVTITGNTIHKNAKLKVKVAKLCDEGECMACDAIRQRKLNPEYLLVFEQDISLTEAFTGTLNISIPVDPQYDGATVSILHCNDGTLDTFTAQVASGKAVFTVVDLSPFVAFVELQSMFTPTPMPTPEPTPTPVPTPVPTPMPTATMPPANGGNALFGWLLGGIVVLALIVFVVAKLMSRKQ